MAIGFFPPVDIDKFFLPVCDYLYEIKKERAIVAYRPFKYANQTILN